jgi:homoserine O-succinyltransferase
MFNHLEYDADTLQREYLRDRAAGLQIAPPSGYFPGDDPSRPPVNTWRPAAQTLFANWLQQMAAARHADGICSSISPLRGLQRFGHGRPSIGFGF